MSTNQSTTPPMSNLHSNNSNTSVAVVNNINTNSMVDCTTTNLNDAHNTDDTTGADANIQTGSFRNESTCELQDAVQADVIHHTKPGADTETVLISTICSVNVSERQQLELLQSLSLVKLYQSQVNHHVKSINHRNNRILYLTHWMLEMMRRSLRTLSII